MVTTSAPEISNLGALRASGHQQRSLRAELRANLLDLLARGEDPWPGLHGLEDPGIPQLELGIIPGDDGGRRRLQPFDGVGRGVGIGPRGLVERAPLPPRVRPPGRRCDRHFHYRASRDFRLSDPLVVAPRARRSPALEAASSADPTRRDNDD